ncbi:MAG TPA: SpaA isopeptide-forming pilin-related protein, partial [Candidatus Limnocylindrales bacterium]|nr:SpaA isopeptide-forming pilin-related protein [Candidatus Limnocylindrales bacterium]
MVSRGIWRFSSARTRRGLTLLWVALFVCSLLLQYASIGVPTALAASGLKASTVQGFEIDGDLVSGDGASNPGSIPAALIDSLTNGDDWLDGASGSGVVDPANPPASTIIADPADSHSDNQFIGGAKELDTRTWGYTTGPITGKDDMKHVMAYAKFVGNSAYFYAGAERIINTGDTHIDFELNRKPFKTYSDGVSKPDRSVGDILISLEFSNGGSDPIVTVYKVTGVTNYASGQTVTVGSDIATSAAVHSATNFEDLAGSGFGYTVPSFEFAETSIDLSALGISTSCPGLSSGHIRTRAGGDVSSSQLKDTSAPFPIDLNNCGKLRIEKHADSASGALLGGATFTVDPNPLPGGSGKLTIEDNKGSDANNTDGVIDLDPVRPGDYTVCETVAPTGYNLASPACKDVTVPANGGFADATVKFADPRKTATTELSLQAASPTDGSLLHAGDAISLTVRETNTGESTLSNVHVNGTSSCASWTAASTKVGGGSFNGTLATGEAVDFSCSFNAPGDDFSWSATGHGKDELGDPASDKNETVEGGYDVLSPATELTLVSAPSKVHAGDSVTIVVKETNTGDGAISDVSVTGTGSCASWTAAANKNGGAGAFSGSLDAGQSVNFSCTFTAPADGSDISWTALGHGTDGLGGVVPADGEDEAGTIEVIKPATELTIVSAPTQLDAGDEVTLVVRETNTGDSTLTGVSVTGTGSCPTWTAAANKNDGAGAFSGSLQPGESVDFSCTFTPSADPTSWTALGHGTDELDTAAPADGESQNGSIDLLHPATTLTLVSAPTTVEHGASVTIAVRETNTGDVALTDVSVTGSATGGHCAAFVAEAGFDGTLDPGEHADFSCTFTAGTADISWSALGHGTYSLGAAPAANEDEAGRIDVLNPATTLTLVSENPDPVVEHGSTTITVRETNTGDSALSNVHVTALDGDSRCADGDWQPVDGSFDGTLDPGEHADFACTIADVGTDDVVWNALGHGTDALQNPAPDTNEDESGTVHVVNPNIDVVKTAGSSLGSQAADGTVYTTLDGSTVVYKYVVTTLDPDGLTAVSVSDDKCSPVAAVTNGGHNVGDTNANDTLEPGESWVFQCSATLTIADDGATVHNVATASGQPVVGGRVDETDDADVALRHPAATITKTVDDADHIVQNGDEVTYHLSVAVTGGPTDLTVTDDLPLGVAYVDGSASDGGTLSGETADGQNGTLTWHLSGVETGTIELTYRVTIVATGGTLENVATVCVPAFNDFDEACDQDTQNVVVPGISITKTDDDQDGIVGRGQTVTYTLHV